MRGLRFGRPSPALVIAVIALLMAMVGTGYAAFKLPKNSVGTKQLKKNSVTGAKVKKGTLTGKNINLAKLGTVPSATTATTATTAGTASALTPPEAVHLVGAAGQPAFMGGSQNPPTTVGGASLQKVGFFKDHDGVVHLQGIALAGKGTITGTVTPVFQLPPGYRPTSNTILLFPATSTSTALIAGSNTSIEGVNIEGLVLGTEEQAVVLDGVTFRAES